MLLMLSKPMAHLAEAIWLYGAYFDATPGALMDMIPFRLKNPGLAKSNVPAGCME
jgi:hypothetical protein